MWRELLAAIRSRRTRGRGTERDVRGDRHQALSRPEGGNPDREHTTGGTTGTEPNRSFVGRISGEDSGYAEQTGAEARAEARAERTADTEQPDATEKDDPGSS